MVDFARLVNLCSNVVLAFAKLEFIPDQEVVDALGKEALAKIATFSPQVRGC